MAQAGRGGGGARGGQGGAGREGSGAGSTGGRDSAMGGRGGSKSSGGGNQFGGIGSGFGVGPGTQGPTKAPAMRDPSGQRAGLPSNETKLDGVKGFFGGLLGYDTYGDLRTAYQNNPNRPGGKFAGYTGMIPSFPNASFGYVAASLLDAPLGPIGWAGMPARFADAAFGGTGEGLAARLAREAGMGPGMRGPDVPGGGTERGGRGQALGYQLPPGYMAQQPVTQPPQVPQVQPYGQLNRGPTNLSVVPGYGVTLPGYGYFK